jgi:hypothetical protein
MPLRILFRTAQPRHNRRRMVTTLCGTGMKYLAKYAADVAGR